MMPQLTPVRCEIDVDGPLDEPLGVGKESGVVRDDQWLRWV